MEAKGQHFHNLIQSRQGVNPYWSSRQAQLGRDGKAKEIGQIWTAACNKRLFVSWNIVTMQLQGVGSCWFLVFSKKRVELETTGFKLLPLDPKGLKTSWNTKFRYGLVPFPNSFYHLNCLRIKKHVPKLPSPVRVMLVRMFRMVRVVKVFRLFRGCKGSTPEGVSRFIWALPK